MANGKIVRIVCGTPWDVESEVNALIGEYSAVLWHFYAVGEVPMVLVVMVSAVYLRQQQLQSGVQTGLFSPGARRGS